MKSPGLVSNHFLLSLRSTRYICSKFLTATEDLTSSGVRVHYWTVLFVRSRYSNHHRDVLLPAGEPSRLWNVRILHYLYVDYNANAFATQDGWGYRLDHLLHNQ